MPVRQARPIAPTADEVPVTRAMLAGVRNEVLQRIDQAREEAKAGKAELEADIQRLDGKIDAVKSEIKADIHELKADIHDVKAIMHGMDARMARMEVMIEAQETRNKVALDAVAALLSRQNQVEQRVTQVEDTVRSLAAGRPSG